MDDTQVRPEVLAAEYRFLARFNRATAAASALLDAIERRVEPRAGHVSVVDCGTGGADIPRALLASAAGRTWTCSCLGTDSNEQAIAYARARPAVPGLALRALNLLEAPAVLGEKSADVVHASLVLHHLEDAEVVDALRAMAGVARQLVVWNDLLRDRVGVLGARLSTLFSRRELRRDAVVSVHRSFTLDEARMLAEAAGLGDIEVRRVRGARFVLTARPHANDPPHVARASHAYHAPPAGHASHLDHAPRPDHPPPASRPMARASGLRFSYGARTVLANVSFVARSGECVLVKGANGSGKSTLLACVAGALPASRRMLWLDRTSGPPGYLPQEGGLFSALDGYRNIELAARLAGVPRAERAARCRAVIEAMHLGEHLARPVQELSGGFRRRVALACAAVHAPNALILDEPDAGLDATGRAALMRLIAETVGAGGVALIATHSRDPSEIVPPGMALQEVAL